MVGDEAEDHFEGVGAVIVIGFREVFELVEELGVPAAESDNPILDVRLHTSLLQLFPSLALPDCRRYSKIMMRVKSREKGKRWWHTLEEWLLNDPILLPEISICALVFWVGPKWGMLVPALYLTIFIFYHSAIRRRRKPWWLRLEKWLYEDAALLPQISFSVLVFWGKPTFGMAVLALHLIFGVFYFYRTRSCIWSLWGSRKIEKAEAPVAYALPHVVCVLFIVLLWFHGMGGIVDIIFN